MHPNQAFTQDLGLKNYVVLLNLSLGIFSGYEYAQEKNCWVMCTLTLTNVLSRWPPQSTHPGRVTEPWFEFSESYSIDWMERIQVRVGGGEALVVHPSPVVAIPEPERKGTGHFHPSSEHLCALEIRRLLESTCHRCACRHHCMRTPGPFQSSA